MRIFPENLATFKQLKNVVKKNWEKIFAKYSVDANQWG